MQRSGAQCSQLDPLEPGAEVGREPERITVAGPVATSGQDAHAATCQAPQGEREHSRRRWVEPFHVVDRDEHGSCL